MRIHELEIQRFGVWKEVTLPFHDRGVTVLYGPNEAGKSTLMRFIRGVLYGYQASDELDASRRQERVICSGSLKVSHQGKSYRIRRVSEKGTRGVLEINGNKIKQNDPLMQSLIGDASESLFRDVFAIGLTELQQLATLSGDEIAEQIYGLSLGREGEQIVRANNAFTKTENFLVDPDQRKGEIYSLLQELAEIDRELERVGQPAQRHNRLIDQTSKHDTSVSELKRKQANLQSDLRGYQFLNQVYEPWAKHRKLLHAFNQLPVTNLDVEILRRFDEMELDLSEVDSKRKQLIEEAKRLQKQAEGIQLRPELEEEVCAIRNLHEQSREIQGLEQQLQGKQSTPNPQNYEVQQVLATLDGHWDLNRLNATDLSPTALHELLRQGEEYRQSNRARTKASKKYKRMVSALKDHEQESRVQSRGLGAKNIEQVREELINQIDELESLRGLKIRKTHLQKTARLFPEEQEVETVDQPLPPFFYNTLWFFAIPGFVLFLAGTFKALSGLGSTGPHIAIIGACYSLLGLSSLGICWTMKQYFSQQKVQVKSFDGDKRKIAKELDHVEQSILRIQNQHLLQPLRNAPQALVANRDDTKLIEETLNDLRKQLHGLQATNDNTQNNESLRRRMSEMRTSLQDYQKRVSQARRNWTEALRRLGLAETLKVDEAVIQCQKIADAKSAVDKWNRSHQSVEQKQQQVETFLGKVQQLSTKIEGRGIAVRDPYQLLEEWHSELELLGERRRERTQLRSTAKEKRREASRFVDKVERMREQRSLLLSQLGVADRGDIAAKLAAIDERKTLEAELKGAEHTLFNVTKNEPELVITEDMLEEYEEAANRLQLNQIRDELQEIDETLQREYQTLGKLKQEVRDIEEDRSVASLRFDREQVADALRVASESLLSNRLANRVVDELRGRIERDRQPQTLLTASEYLRQLTCDKYRNVWTPLGEKSLLVDDDSQQSLRVEQLSSGTREQVFLALRLAMIKDFAAQGVELPMILDDVTVNFDQIRTEAAVETLLNVADEGQQVMLFTCHLHLAHLFEAENVEPVWLPNHRPEMTV
jgi:uncharacterized protein YhaN